MKGTLIVFVKAPVAGRVKTRLAHELGPARAAATFRHLTRQTIAHASLGDWRTVLAVDPPAARSGFFNVWPGQFDRLVQARGDLGDRLEAAFRAAPSWPVLVIGADAPFLRSRHIRAAYQVLAGHDAAFGPSEDGGFWLMGLRRPLSRRALKNIRWSTRNALADTLKRLPESWSVAFLERLRDVDDAADFAALGPRGLRRSPARP